MKRITMLFIFAFGFGIIFLVNDYKLIRMSDY